ncbi:UDP-galactopyranose/dTDP-fucopyranose mutase family protein [Enterobacter quasiroggenkampii]|uniref:UDP-galactopyranose/dTDP-fucopyranose mutase family protein n=1 Tax=Enterobacter quasiroggenkampii TaxID=2497436 RepID=UPI0021CECEC1|nr:UDP-galactopyranose mutase [Enterobacter quasiroggenkampii]MCU6278381.1 NAD(P)-binding protein [Enterobacter quasiroggenkampii]
MTFPPVFIAGAGLAGSTVARLLAEKGARVTVYEARDRVAGNCYDLRCPQTGVRVHQYGPHIFHTADEAVWAFVNRFARFIPYHHRVFTTARGQVWSLPVNLLTLSQFRGQAMDPQEARRWLATLAIGAEQPAKNLEARGLQLMGRALYDTFFRGYTEKQWGCPAAELPAAILNRLPFRFDFSDGYFSHPYQGMPENGYTDLIQTILDHPGITVITGSPMSPAQARDIREEGHLFWTGPLDAYFHHDAGRLRYRTLDFVREVVPADWQGCAVMNYADPDIPWTRITDHARLSPWEHHEKTVIYREFSREAGLEDIPYYPVRLAGENALLGQYEARARQERNVTFLGRLGTCRYLDMDATIAQAMQAVQFFMFSLSVKDNRA